MENVLPPIPAKRYFTIGEVAELCGVKPHVLRYWEQEFTQLRPMKRRGNRRYYQHHEVLMIRRIRGLLYDQGFTINGARHKLQEIAQSERERSRSGDFGLPVIDELDLHGDELGQSNGLPEPSDQAVAMVFEDGPMPEQIRQVERELKAIRDLLTVF
ncbi:MerR family transcriptional regulator [Ottowia thiooxydans]|uniref:MerR family transcriptional regulator n=1 Tax=Ottowia thiooxydans TaxID=219182 RepID=UPI00040A045D|nr:MerR family transcriptional regulator [Ottowia thiooxydans]